MGDERCFYLGAHGFNPDSDGDKLQTFLKEKDYFFIYNDWGGYDMDELKHKHIRLSKYFPDLFFYVMYHGELDNDYGYLVFHRGRFLGEFLPEQNLACKNMADDIKHLEKSIEAGQNDDDDTPEALDKDQRLEDLHESLRELRIDSMWDLMKTLEIEDISRWFR